MADARTRGSTPLPLPHLRGWKTKRHCALLRAASALLPTPGEQRVQRNIEMTLDAAQPPLRSAGRFDYGRHGALRARQARIPAE